MTWAKKLISRRYNKNDIYFHTLPAYNNINFTYLSFNTSDNILRVKIFYHEFNLQKIVQSTYYDVSFPFCFIV